MVNLDKLLSICKESFITYNYARKVPPSSVCSAMPRAHRAHVHFISERINVS